MIFNLRAHFSGISNLRTFQIFLHFIIEEDGMRNKEQKRRKCNGFFSMIFYGPPMAQNKKEPISTVVGVSANINSQQISQLSSISLNTKSLFVFFPA